MQVRLVARPLAGTRADVRVLLVPCEAIPRLRTVAGCGARGIAELGRRGFIGAEGTGALLRGSPLAVIGLGPEGSVRLESFRLAGGQFAGCVREIAAGTVALDLIPGTRATLDAAALGAFVEGLLLGVYTFRMGARNGPAPRPPAVLIVAGARSRDAATFRRAARHAEVLASATNRARGWINLPAGELTPRAFAEDAKRAGAAAGLEVRVEGPRAIARRGMGALLGVAQGSVEEPRFIRVTYRPKMRRVVKGRIALVGKGITFDSGGLSLKSPGGMEHMKRDMAGGAAVLGAMLAIGRLRPPIEVRAYVPASENMPGGGAMRPGDILHTASGTTVEVLNTDAEGRLVLADALACAVRERPDVIVDLATLTGAVRHALGSRIAGVMGNDPAVVRTLCRAGADTGEQLWELPLVRSYRADLDSTVADLKNVGSNGYGGSIRAGLFLEEFVAEHPWAHLDIAGVAFTDRPLPYTPRGAVGFGVRLLVAFVQAVARGALTSGDRSAENSS